MDWLETWRDSWSPGSATASSSSSSSATAARGGNDQDDAHAATTENAAAKKRRQEVATASPSDEPRRTKRVRKPTAALAEFRIELNTRGKRTGPPPDDDAGDPELPLISTRRAHPRARHSTVSGNEPTTTHESASSRHLTRPSSSKGLGDGNSLGTSESGNTTLQVEDTMAGALKPQQQRMRGRRLPWSPAEDARLRTAIFTFAGLDPASTDTSIDQVKVKNGEWPEVKRIFDALAPPESASSGPPRSVYALQGHFYSVLLRRSQQAPPVTVPAEAGPSPSGSHSLVSPTPPSSATAIPSGSAGANIVEEVSQRADNSATDSGQDGGREESALPNQAAAVASFESAAAAAFFPGFDDPMNGSPSLETAPESSIASGSATAPAITPFQDSAAAPASNLDSSTPSVGGLSTLHHQTGREWSSGPTRDAQDSADAEKGASIERSAEPNPGSEASGTPAAGTGGAAATNIIPRGNVSSTASASAGSGAPPAGPGGKTTGCRHFTAAEDAHIIELYGVRTPQTHIARALNRSYSSLWQRVNLLRQRGMISQPLPAASPAAPPRKTPAVGASVTSTDPSPAAVTTDAQQAVAGSTMSPASSSSMAVPSSLAPLDNPQIGSSSSEATPATLENGPVKKATAPKRFSAEEDQQIVELRASGMEWQVIGSRLQRTKATCARRYALLKEKAQLAGQDLSSYIQPPKPAAAGGQAGQAASGTPPPISSTPAQPPAATSAPLPPYTVEDDTIILRMYLQGNSAERIGIAIKRSAFSVNRRWTKKKDGWIAAGLLTAGSRLKLHDDPPSQRVVSAATKSPVDPFADLRHPTTSGTSAQADAHVPTGSPASRTPTLEPAENNLGGFDASFFSIDDMAIDPSLLNLGIDWVSGTAGEVASPLPQGAAVASTRTRQESPRVPTASEHGSSTPEMAAEKILAQAMPHYDSGMQGLNRFLRLIKDGGKKKR